MVQMNQFAGQKLRCREQTYRHQGRKAAGVGGGGGVMNWEIGIDMYTLMCIKLMANKNLLYTKTNKIQKFKKKRMRKVWTSLMVQWSRIRLPMTGTRVRALVREDPTCHGATKPMCHNYGAYALEPVCHNYQSPCASSPCSATREATAMRSTHTATKSSPRSPQLERARAQWQGLSAAKNK